MEYYTITDSGLKELKIFKSKWQALNKGMINLFGGKTMLSKQSQDFLEKLRVELLFRGKTEEEVEELLEELKII